MARGGSRGRRTSYVRDNSGRFASTPGGGPPKRSTPATRRAAMRKALPKVTGGTLGARGSLRRSRAKLAGKNPADRSLQGSLSLRAQRGAVTRGANRLGKVRAASTVRMAARAGVIRGGRKVAAKPVVAPRSSVRVIRPNRPAMRPGPAPDRGKISEYVGAVRGARRRLSSAKPGSANAAEAKQGLKDSRRALSRRIQRERGARRGLKPATSQQVLTGTVPAPPAKRAKAARPSGTLAKPRGLKPGAIAARKAKAAASGARAARATTNYNRAQKAALEAQQRLNRRRSPKNLAAADKAQTTLQTAARAYRILVGLGGEKMAVARKPSPKGAGPRMKAARPAGTVAKPKGLKPDRWIKKERVIGRGEVWMGKWTPPSGGKVKAGNPPKQKRSAPRLSFSDTATRRRFNRSGDFALYRYRENQAAVMSGDKTAQLKAGRNQFIRFLASNLNRQALKATATQRKKAYQSIKRFSTISNPQPGGDWKRNRDRAAMDEIKRLKETARQDGIGGKWDPRNRTKRKPGRRKP
jgi:hypothetical protein